MTHDDDAWAYHSTGKSSNQQGSTHDATADDANDREIDDE